MEHVDGAAALWKSINYAKNLVKIEENPGTTRLQFIRRNDFEYIPETQFSGSTRIHHSYYNPRQLGMTILKMFIECQKLFRKYDL